MTEEIILYIITLTDITYNIYVKAKDSKLDFFSFLFLFSSIFIFLDSELRLV